MKKEETFKDDLYYYMNIRKKNKEIFNNFSKLYDEFIKLNNITQEELEKNTIRDVSTNEFKEYILNNSNDLRFLLNALIKMGYMSLEDIRKSIVISVLNLNLYKQKFDQIKSVDDLIHQIKIFIESDMVVYKRVLEWAIKVYVIPRGKILREKQAFFNKACPVFKEYYDLILEEKIIPDELIKKIQELMLDPLFVIPRDNYEEDTPDALRLLKYITEFANYTEFHNLTVEKNKEMQKLKEKERKEKLEEEKRQKEKKIAKEKEISASNEAVEEEVIEQEENQNIAYMVQSYLPGICEENKCSVTPDMLPNSFDPNYDEIIIGLLKAYEEYTSSQEKNSMAAFNKYNDLVFMVEEIKNKKNGVK